MNFGVLTYPGVEELDFQGPWEMVGMWHKYAQGPKPILVSRSLEPVACAHGMRVLPDCDFSGAGELSALLVPGGFAAFEEMKRADMTGFIATTHAAGAAILSVCSGTFMLHAAGVLAGRRASTNWKVVGMLRDLGVEVVEERYSRDGRIWTSAGVSAGMDMLLAYIADSGGEDAASLVQLHAEYFPDGRVYGGAIGSHPMPEYVRRLIRNTV